MSKTDRYVQSTSDRRPLEYLVAAVKEDVSTLAERMHLDGDAVIVNQCDTNDYLEYDYNGHRVRAYSFKERGVGLSRNSALMRAEGEICVFADEDIVYRDGAAADVIQAFAEHPEADMLLFNVEAAEGRATYHTTEFGRVRWYNSGRYPTYSFACRTESVRRANVCFSLLYGGGARHSNGEDSLFLMDCLRAGLKVYKVPVSIGKENGRPSTWFKGCNDKFFYDRGVLYHDLYGVLAPLMALRFLWNLKKPATTPHWDPNTDLSFAEAWKVIREGIAGKREI